MVVLTSNPDYSGAQPNVTGGAYILPICSITKGENFDPPFGGLIFHVLFEPQSTFEGDHFIDGHILRGSVVGFEFFSKYV